MAQPALWTGILLAAGRSQRFDPAGQSDKLLQALADGRPLALASAQTLLSVMDEVVAVVRPDAPALLELLQAAGCRTVVCADAASGMSASLRHALQHAADSAGWIVALADMPQVRPDTVARLLQALQHGASIAVPLCQGRRGNPVGFAHAHLPELLAISGDQGARQLLRRHTPTEVDVDDPGIWQDVDTPDDLTIVQTQR